MLPSFQSYRHFILAFRILKSKIPVEKTQSSVTSVNGIFHHYFVDEWNFFPNTKAIYKKNSADHLEDDF